MTTLLVCALVAAPKLAMTPLRGGDGTTSGMTEMVGESVAAEIRRTQSFQVLTYGELKTVLSHEQVNQLVGCSDAGCFANIGSVAGAEALATGRLGQVGKSWLIALKIIDVRAVRVVATADRRVRDGTIDDVLDQLPGMVSELVEGAVERLGAAGARSTAAVTAVSATSSKHEIPVAHARVALATPLSRLQLLSDGRGHLVAFETDRRHAGELLAGDRAGLYRQRVRGSSASGSESWSVYFWDPRTRHPSLTFADGAYVLRCGRDIPLAPVDQPVPATFEVRWQRTAVVLARDDRGTYYYVDKRRGGDDYRLFVGTRGRVEYLPLSDAIIDAHSSIFISDRGRLIATPTGRDAWQVTWAVGDAEQELTAMSLWTQAKMVYGSLGAYSGQPLGTPCDPFLEDAR